MKKVDINELIWFIILLGFTVYIYMLVSTGRINTFVHPKMLRYVAFSLGAFALLSLFQLRKIFEDGGSGRKIKPGFILFLIPLVLGFGVNPGGINSDVAAKKGITIIQVAKQNIGDDNNSKNLKSTIEIDEKNFLDYLEKMQNNLETYKGKRVIISGFVFKDDDIRQGEFVTARMMMNCCAADVQVVGFLCRYGSGKLPEKDQWVKVTGTIDTAQYMNNYSDDYETIPLVVVEKIESIPKPSTQYVYP